MGGEGLGSLFRSALEEVTPCVHTRLLEADNPPSLDDVDLSHLGTQVQTKVRKMLKKFESMWNGKLGVIRGFQHCISLLDGSEPVAMAPRRAGPQDREIILREVERMLEEGAIREAQSEWAAPVLIFERQDGSPGFCIDYHRLNELTVKDSYPLPRMEDCLDSLGDARNFSTLDCNSGYWQIPVTEEDLHKTAFTCHVGCYEFCRMPFGLTNAPATLQRVMDLLLSKYRWKSCLVYIDDVIVFSNTTDEHLQHVKEVLTVMWDEFSSAVTFGYNNTAHRGTGLTPFQLVFTRPPRPLVLNDAEEVNYSGLSPTQRKEIFRRRLRVLMQTADERQRASQSLYKSDFDKKVKVHNQDIQIGDGVFVRRETPKEVEDRG